jgi:putative transposase
MNTFKRHRFPPDIISYAVWLYFRFNLSHRRCAGPFIEDLLAERGITVSRESIRLWCIKFGALYARRLKRKHQGYGDTFFIDEVFVKINGKQHYLWRAVDQDGEVVDVYLQAKRDGAAAKRFASSNQLGRHSGSWVLMQLSIIYSISVGIWYPPTIIEISGSVRLQNGKGRLRRAWRWISVVRLG